MATDGPTGGTEFLVDPRRAVEATVFEEHSLDFSSDQRIVRLALSRRQLLPAVPGVIAAAGNNQPATQPGDMALISELIDQAKPLGGSSSLAKCAAVSLKNLFLS